MNEREKQVWDSTFGAAYAYLKLACGQSGDEAFVNASDVADQAIVDLRYAKKRVPEYGEIV